MADYNRGAQFKSVETPRVFRNRLDLSHEIRATMNLFMLYPVLVDHAITGDVWKIGHEMVLRVNPMVAPLMHEINVYRHDFFVPFRLLNKGSEDFEQWLTGGSDGEYIMDVPKCTFVPGTHRIPGSLWDFLGFNVEDSSVNAPIMSVPVAYPWRAYNLIYNEYYRDQNLYDPVDLENVSSSVLNHDTDIHVRAFEKDYFTSMLPDQQRGPAMALPISGNLPINVFAREVASWSDPPQRLQFRQSTGALPGLYLGGSGILSDSTTAYPDVFVNLANGATFDVADLRFSFQLQKFLERNARTGSRFVEFLKAHFRSYPRDERLQRPEYIGGSKVPIVISEVLQTSSSDSTTPQGNLAGHGITAVRQFSGSYHVQEPGVIMSIMSIMPRTMYSQGIDRVWMFNSRYDLYFPEFQGLSEQPVFRHELWNYGTDDPVIGYQGRYDEYRYKRSRIAGLMHNSFRHWHLARKFYTAPSYNRDLIRSNYSEQNDFKRFLAVPSQPAFIVSIGNKLSVTRPMPWRAEPGYTDHH